MPGSASQDAGRCSGSKIGLICGHSGASMRHARANARPSADERRSAGPSRCGTGKIAAAGGAARAGGGCGGSPGCARCGSGGTAEKELRGRGGLDPVRYGDLGEGRLGVGFLIPPNATQDSKKLDDYPRWHCQPRRNRLVFEIMFLSTRALLHPARGGIAMVLAGVFVFGLAAGSMIGPVSSGRTAAANTPPPADAGAAPPVSRRPLPVRQVHPVQVVRIVDGDTFDARVNVRPGVEIDARVRLRGIDAPRGAGALPGRTRSRPGGFA